MVELYRQSNSLIRWSLKCSYNRDTKPKSWLVLIIIKHFFTYKTAQLFRTWLIVSSSGVSFSSSSSWSSALRIDWSSSRRSLPVDRLLNIPAWITFSSMFSLYLFKRMSHQIFTRRMQLSPLTYSQFSFYLFRTMEYIPKKAKFLPPHSGPNWYKMCNARKMYLSLFKLTGSSQIHHPYHFLNKI